RASPSARLFVRISHDAKAELPSQDFDLLPETLRVMRRLGASTRPEMRALCARAVVTARAMLTPDELRSCVEFLTHALERVSGAAGDPSAAVEEPPAGE